jgi:hypothetical protein
MFLSRVSIALGCRSRQCSLLCLAKSIPCCRARQNEHCRARSWRVSSQIGAVLCPAAKGFQCAVLFQLRRSCGGGTALINGRTRLPRFSAGQQHGYYRINKRTSLPPHEHLRAAAARSRYPALVDKRRK